MAELEVVPAGDDAAEELAQELGEAGDEAYVKLEKSFVGTSIIVRIIELAIEGEELVDVVARVKWVLDRLRRRRDQRGLPRRHVKVYGPSGRENDLLMEVEI